MKWLFILLLLTNMAILVWGIQYEPVDPAQEITQHRGVGNLRLLSEIEAAKEEQVEPPAVESDLVTAEPQQAAEAPLEVAEQPQPAVVTTKPKPAAKLVSRCGVFGVIDDRQIAQEARKQLTGEGVKSSLQETNGKIEIGFWVVIPPLESSEAAQEMIDQLAEAGITDVWHFRSGELNNAVSLGMFFQQENAEKLRSEIEQKGFNAELRSRFLNKRRYSIHFKIKDEAGAVKRIWNRLKQRYPDIDMSERPCGEIATEQ